MGKNLEVKEVAFMMVPVRQKSIYEGGFMQVSQQGLARLAQDKTLGAQAHRVLFCMMATAEFENIVMVDAKTIANELEMSLSNVYAAITKLKGVGVIEQHPTKHRFLQIGGKLAWKGTRKQYQRAQDVGEALT